LAKLKTLHSECFISDNLQCKDYFYTVYPLTGSPCTNYMANKKATISYLLIFHHRCSVHIAHSCLYCDL